MGSPRKMRVFDSTIGKHRIVVSCIEDLPDGLTFIDYVIDSHARMIDRAADAVEWLGGGWLDDD